jgi:hypothetical protein
MPRRKTLPQVLTMAIAALALTFGVAGFTNSASAQDAPKLLGKYDDWSAYTYGSGNDRMCYAMTTPVKMLPAGASRGDVYFMVTHRPARKTKNEVSMRVGYPFKSTSRPFATVEHRFWAWLENPSEEGKMVQALKSGSSMEIKGTSERDTLTTDTYSLKGSSAALKKIDDACR